MQLDNFEFAKAKYCHSTFTPYLLVSWLVQRGLPKLISLLERVQNKVEDINPETFLSDRASQKLTLSDRMSLTAFD